MKSFLKLFRRYFFILFAFLSYIFFAYNFYFNGYWLMASVFLFLFYILSHFFFIELKSYGLKYFVAIIIFAALIQMFIIGFDGGIFKILSVWAINIGIVGLFNNINSEVNNRKKLDQWLIFNMGVSSFSMFCALSYAFMFVSTYTTFGLTCDTLSQNTNNFINFVSKPFKISVYQANNLKNNLNSFYNKKITDVLGFGSGESLICAGHGTGDSKPMIYGQVNKLYLFQKLLTGANFSGNEIESKLFTGKNLSGNLITGTNTNEILCNLLSGKDIKSLNLNPTSNDDSKQGTGLLGFVNKTQGEVLQSLTDKRQLDKGFCDVMISAIKDKYNNPGFKISVIILLFFVLWPSLRILFGIVGFLGFVLFSILKIFKLYRLSIVTEEVEEID